MGGALCLPGHPVQCLPTIEVPFAELLDASRGPQIEHDVHVAASSSPHVIGLEKCHVRKVGFRFYVDLHVVVNGALTVREGHKIAHDVKAHVLQAVPRVAEVFSTRGTGRGTLLGLVVALSLFN